MRVDPFYVTNLVSALDRAQGREQQLANELSSGVRFNRSAMIRCLRGAMFCF